MLLGIVGSWVGTFPMGLLGLSGVVPALVGSVVGATLILGVYRLFKKR